uniref:Putative endoplasmic reticulum-based factor for assembly of v-atpase n=1 Tax=Anopheles triannulatus TaxID=58253 RepID=A0A2M4AJM6_9DIPT
MSKLPITDPAIRIAPTKELKQFIGTKLAVPPSAPATLRNIHSAYNKAGQRSTTGSAVEQSKPSISKSAAEFTATERRVIEDCITKPEQDDETTDPVCVFDCDTDDTKPASMKNCLGLADIRWLFNVLTEMRKTDSTVPFLHTLLVGCPLVMPENPVQERNPVLEARCQLLRKQQEERDYNRMTKNVDSIRKHMPEETIGYQVKQINRHLIAVAQFLFSVAAGFAFGFVGIGLIVGQMDFGVRLLLGIVIALIIALAEIYFLAKRLNAEYELPSVPSPLAPKEFSTKVVESIPIQVQSKRGGKKKQHKE